MLKIVLISIITTLSTIVLLLGKLHDIPSEPVFGAIQPSITATGTYYRYLNYEGSTSPTVTRWGMCNKIPDIQGGGFTYLTTYNGEPTFSKISCE